MGKWQIGCHYLRRRSNSWLVLRKTVVIKTDEFLAASKLVSTYTQ